MCVCISGTFETGHAVFMNRCSVQHLYVLYTVWYWLVHPTDPLVPLPPFTFRAGPMCLPKGTPWTATQCICGGHIGSGFDQVAHTVLLVVQVAHTVLLVLKVSGHLFCCSSTAVVVGIAEIYCNAIAHCQELCPQQFCLDGGCGSDDKEQSATSRKHQVREGSVQPTVSSTSFQVSDGTR